MFCRVIYIFHFLFTIFPYICKEAFSTVKVSFLVISGDPFSFSHFETCSYDVQFVTFLIGFLMIYLAVFRISGWFF